MPEGDTIRRIAAALAPELLDRRLVDAACRFDGVVGGLPGRRIERIRPRGKHLLIELDDGSALHVHLGMKGCWHRYRPGERWRLPREAMGLVLRTAERELVCFYPPTVERLRLDALHLHPVLGQLGPDLLDAQPDFDAMVAAALATPARPVEEVLLDQRVACGIGNIYKCEALAREGLHPRLAVGEVGEAGVMSLYRRAALLMNASLARAAGSGGGRGWQVYKRRVCGRCGGRVAFDRAPGPKARDTWWCPRCQGVGDAGRRRP